MVTSTEVVFITDIFLTLLFIPFQLSLRLETFPSKTLTLGIVIISNECSVKAEDFQEEPILKHKRGRPQMQVPKNVHSTY